MEGTAPGIGDGKYIAGGYNYAPCSAGIPDGGTGEPRIPPSVAFAGTACFTALAKLLEK